MFTAGSQSTSHKREVDWGWWGLGGLGAMDTGVHWKASEMIMAVATSAKKPASFTLKPLASYSRLVAKACLVNALWYLT